MPLPFGPPLEPMLAQARDEFPVGPGWCYEPKWDGFRAIVFRDGDAVHLSSRNSRPLQRYFPEVVASLKAALPPTCVLDGEIILPGPKGLDFEALQTRLHPAASRVARLAKETPAAYVAFDLLALEADDWRERSFAERREKLVQLIAPPNAQPEMGLSPVFPTPQTLDPAVARAWFDDFEGAGCDGVIARRLELPYRPGERVMVKVKHQRTADCVVGGYRDGVKDRTVGSLLLGLYDSAGALHYVGHTASFNAAEKRELFERLQPLRAEQSFSGRTPDAPSRWSGARGRADVEEKPWTMLRPELVCEVRFDYLQGARFRHATTFLRWRTDKDPQACDYSQIEPPHPFSLTAIIELAKPSAPA